MKTQQQHLYKILSNFEGMTKLDAFDLLQKMEVLLFYAKSPLRKKEIKDIILSNMDTDEVIDPFQFSILSNGNFCEFVASNNWMHIYKEIPRGIGRLWPVPKYYFKTKYAPLELVRLTSKNLLNNVQETDHEYAVFTFLNNHSIIAKDKDSIGLLLLSAVI